MKNFIFKNRGEILLVITIIDVFFSIFMVADAYDEISLYWYIEVSSNFLVIAIAIYLYVKLGEYEYLVTRNDVINNHSPAVSIYYDAKMKQLNVSESAATLLNLPAKKQYNIEDLKQVFEKQDWEGIKKFFKHEQDYKLIDNTGSVAIQNRDYSQLFLRYHAHHISSISHDLEGVIFWFADFTDSIKSEFELIDLVKRYRLIAFEFDVIFNHLPFPVWRREANGEVVFYNKAFAELDNELKKETSANVALEKIMKNLANEAIGTSQPARTKKHFIFHNTHHVYEFVEIPLGKHIGNIGVALDVRGQDKLEKTLKSFQSIFENVLEYSNNAIFIIDNKRRVIQFNQAYVNMFELDSLWLATQPQFTQLLDKLRETKKLPEVKDYKDYKELQVQMLGEFSHPQTKFMHLPNGQTLRESIIPSKGGSIIFIYDNVTDILGVEILYNELQGVYAATLESVAEAIVSFNADGRLKSYNQKFVGLFGLNDDYLMSLPHFSSVLEKTQTVDEAGKKLFKAELISCLESRRAKSCQLQCGQNNSIVNIRSMPDASILVVFS